MLTATIDDEPGQEMTKHESLNITQRFIRVADVLRRRPPSEVLLNRSHERYRLAALNGISGLLCRMTSFIASVLTVSLTFRYLGAERYGMWMTITSIVAMLGFADLGMSNGLINLIAEALGKESIDEARKAASSAFWILCVTASIMLVIGVVSYPYLNAAAIFNVSSSKARGEAGPALAVFALCFISQIPLGAVRGVQSGLQKGFANNLWASAGAAGSLIGMLIAIHFEMGLPFLILSVSGPPILAMLLNGVELFGFSHPELRPDPKHFSSQVASNVLHTGFMYLILQLSITIGVQTDNVVIAQILGSKAVADYAVPARMFNLVTSFLVMLSGVMLPAYADAFARNDGLWIRRTFLRISVIGTVVACASALFLVIWGNRILKIWVGPQIQASTVLLLTFASLSVVYAYLQPINFMLSGIRRFKVAVICAILNAVVNLGLSIFFVKRLGIIGAVLGTLVSYVLIQVIPLTFETWRVLKGLASKQLSELAPVIFE